VTETPNNPQHPATVVDLDEAADLDEAVSTFVTDLAEARLSSVDSFGSISCATTTSARAGIASLLHYPRTDHSWCSHRPGPSKSERSQTGNCARRPRRQSHLSASLATREPGRADGGRSAANALDNGSAGRRSSGHLVYSTASRESKAMRAVAHAKSRDSSMHHQSAFLGTTRLGEEKVPCMGTPSTHHR